ncbi:MAG: hypothetical protein Q8O00_11360 [Holophaga sp.]|nr:hypothetical protein [Holophaga sp.]
MKRSWRFLIQGWIVWLFALLGAWLLPGQPWRVAQAPAFAWEIIPTAVALFGVLVVTALGAAWLSGPGSAHSRYLALWEAPPDLLWGGLVLALWPATWGPPGKLAWALAFLLAALPSEIRWLAQALPGEYPFPALWGTRAQRRLRRFALATVAPRWIAVRLPLWLTATLILERMLAVRGLGSDWMARVAAHDRMGLALWVLAFGVIWTLAQPRRIQA